MRIFVAEVGLDTLRRMTSDNSATASMSSHPHDHLRTTLQTDWTASTWIHRPHQHLAHGQQPARSSSTTPDVLIVERGKGGMQGLWSLPGGHIEAGERASAAAIREVHEETGITAEILGLVDVHDVILQPRRRPPESPLRT